MKIDEKASLPEKLFGVKADEKLLAQAVRVYLANQRLAHAKTKTRSAVEKTTAKMYKQKGTGRARHGSYSAPIFVGGGVALGPTGTQNYKMRLPEQMKRLAILGALSEKARAKSVFVVLDVDKTSGKTKEAKDIFNKLGEAKSTLLVVTNEQLKDIKGWKNLKKVKVISVSILNAYEVIKNHRLVVTPEVIKELTKKYVA